MCAFAEYTIYKVQQFITNPSATSTSQISKVPLSTTIPLPTIAFAVQGSSWVDGFQNLIAGGTINYDNTIIQRFSLEFCQLVNSPPSLQNAVVYCPNISNLLIPGTFENSVITTQSLGITLFPNDCASFTAAGTQALFGSILNPFEINFTTGQFVDTYNYDFFRTILVGQLILSSTLPLQIEQYEISPDYLNRWTTQSRTKYSFQPLIMEYVVTGSCNPSVPLIDLQFVVSPTMIITNINYQTIVDLFSNLGALWTTGFGIIAVP